MKNEINSFKISETKTDIPEPPFEQSIAERTAASIELKKEIQKKLNNSNNREINNNQSYAEKHVEEIPSGIYWITHKKLVILQFLNSVLFLSAATVGIYSYYNGHNVLFFLCAVISLIETFYNIAKNNANPFTLYASIMLGIGATIYNIIIGDGISFIFHNISIFLLFINGLVYAFATILCLFNIKRLFYDTLSPRDKKGIFFCIAVIFIIIIFMIGITNNLV